MTASDEKHHLLITGPGRSGTTLLVQILERLGMETNVAHSLYDDIANAGLEWSLTDPDPPYVIKNPKASRRLRRWIEQGVVAPKSLDFVVIAVRDLSQAAQSRTAVSARRGRISAPGGLDNVRWARRQDAELARHLSELVLTLAEYEIPHLLIAYPKLARDSGYCYRALRPALGDIDEASFEAAWKAAVRPELIHEYSATAPSVLQSARLLARDAFARGLRQRRGASANDADSET